MMANWNGRNLLLGPGGGSDDAGDERVVDCDSEVHSDDAG